MKKIESNFSKNVRNNKGMHLVVKNQKLCSVSRDSTKQRFSMLLAVEWTET